MSHSTGISDSYYRPSEKDLLDEYIKAVDALTITNKENRKTSSKEEIARPTDREELYSMVVDIIHEYVINFSDEPCCLQCTTQRRYNFYMNFTYFIYVTNLLKYDSSFWLGPLAGTSC
jgi:hypothetical protein